MALFKCEPCGCIENTALCNWANRRKQNPRALCSECDPDIGEWHKHFDKKPAKGMLLGNDGFLYSQGEIDSGGLDWRLNNTDFKIIRKIK